MIVRVSTFLTTIRRAGRFTLPVAAAVVTLALIVTACRTMPPLNLEIEADVERLYYYRCATCHTLIAPDEWCPDDWPFILDEYGPRSGLTKRERSYLEPWLIREASEVPTEIPEVPQAPDEEPSPDSPGQS